jgi:hypothetical protein
MPTELLVVIAVAALLYAAFALQTYFRTRGVRFVHCPGTRSTAVVELDAIRAGMFLAPMSDVTVRRCSLWPERRDCNQWCCDEIEYSSNGCVFRGILVDWYRNKRCAICQRDIPPIERGNLRPSLRAPDGRLLEWTEIDRLKLFDVLATHAPVCASCDVAEVFRSRYPDLVVERPPRPDHDPIHPPAA